MTNSYLLKSYRVWLVLGVLLLLLVAAESAALRAVFTSKYPGANDFFVRWLGGRALILHGVNPYDQSVAEAAQKAMFGHLSRPEDKDEAYFAYPLYTLYFFWPLSLVPYDWAQAIWMTLLQFMLLAITALSIVLSGWRPPGWLVLVTVLWGIFFYNGARAIILGQFSVLVGLALMLALWAIAAGRDAWAGVLLAVTTIKPQVVFLVIAFLLLWALFCRRRRIVISFALTMAGLVLSSMALVPSWPLDFANNLVAYSSYVRHGTPLENLLHYLLPDPTAAILTPALSVLFFLALLPGWWLALKNRPGAYTWAVMSTLIVGSLITFRSATTNQVILYLPLFFFFYRLTQPSPKGETSQATRHSLFATRHLLVAAILVGLLIFMWVVFAATIQGNYEHIMMHGLLPALLLLLYAVDARGLWRAGQTLQQVGAR